jgi:two-component system, OmpR family, response regulator
LRRPKTILLVGFEPNQREELCQPLSGKDWVIEEAKDNTAALRCVHEHVFDLVVTGAQTSGADDVELLREIRQFRPHMKMIIVTGSGTPADVINSMREHAFSYVSAPFSVPYLAEIIKTALQTPTWGDEIELISATEHWVSLRARCSLPVADRLLQFFRELRSDLEQSEREKVAMAFREILLNAIEHGAKLDPAKFVEIHRIRTGRSLVYYVVDPGAGFSMDHLEHAAIANPADDPVHHMQVRAEQGVRAGGFGLLIAHQMVDEVIYSAKGNEVLLIKYVTQ